MTTKDGLHEIEANHYAVLGLKPPLSTRSKQYSTDEIKQAYRQSLLTHHPDKAQAPVAISIDQIVTAFDCLSDPEKRQVYDTRLLQHQNLTRWSCNVGAGLEQVDLEEFDHDQHAMLWTRDCRCGGHYQVAESELEQSAFQGEIILNCSSCSLCIRVAFIALEETDGAEK